MRWPFFLALGLLVVLAGRLSANSPQAPSREETVLPAGDGAATVRERCLICHGADLIVQQRLDRTGWERELDKMAGWGAVIDAPARAALVTYLAANYGPSAEPSANGAGPSAGDGAAVLQARCLGCHDARPIEQQRLTAEGWRREVDKMIGWGAAVTPEEQTVLVAYLARVFPVSR